MNRRVKLSHLIEAKLFKPPLSIYVRFKGKDFKATIDNDGFILLSGKRYTSLSLAGGVVRTAMSGKPADGSRYRAVNGWDFWKFTDSDGNPQTLNELRKQYAAR